MDGRDPLSSGRRGTSSIVPWIADDTDEAPAQAYVREWTTMAMTETGGARHAKLAYQEDGSWGTLCA